MITIGEDTRPIEKLFLIVEPTKYEQESFIVGVSKNGKLIGSIKPYTENGEMASILWFCIMSGPEIIARVNSKYVTEIYYF